MKRGRGWSLLAAGFLLALGAAVRADEPPPWHPWRLREWPGKLYQGRNNREHTMERAGHPDELSRFAHPSDTGRYFGYYIGGGSVRRGETLGPDNGLGTWGWDYGGFCPGFKRLALLWNPARYQSGYGRYKIDGPPVKDVGPYVEKLKEGPKAIHEIREGRRGGHSEEHE